MSKVAELRDELARVVEDYNVVVEDAQTFIQNLSSDAQEYFDAMSEEWQDKEAEAYADWMDKLNEELNEIDLESPVEIDEVDGSNINTFMELLEEP